MELKREFLIHFCVTSPSKKSTKTHRALASDGGTILKVGGGAKVYPVFSPTAHNAQLLAYSDFRSFSTSYCKCSMSLNVTEKRSSFKKVRP